MKIRFELEKRPGRRSGKVPPHRRFIYSQYMILFVSSSSQKSLRISLIFVKCGLQRETMENM